MGEWSRGSILWPTIALAIVVAINSKSVVAEKDEGGREGEFVAGSFILTQKALNEAPYRYSRFLTEALERMELADPPTKKDEENCNVKYKIEPSGEKVPSPRYERQYERVSSLLYSGARPVPFSF